MKFASVADVETALAQYYTVTKQTTGTDSAVERTKRLLAHVGNPQRKFRTIHIAGTSGKTSTAYYASALFSVAGIRTGLMVSPHIDSITERVQLNGVPIADELFCAYAAEFFDKLEALSEKPAWHECVTALTFWIFAKERVQYAVVETMLGGMHDPTNVLEGVDKLCVLTDIGYDHIAILGKRIEEIAYQKAGIIHDGNATIMYGQSDTIMQVVRYWASQQENAEVYPFEQWRLEKAYKGRYASNLPEYQKHNWLLAFAAYLFVARRDSLKIITDRQMQETQTTHIPARMDTITIGSQSIVMDGAHNPQKMRAFVDSFKARYPDRKVPILLALKQDKQATEVIAILSEVASEVIATGFEKIDGLAISALKPSELVKISKASGISRARVVADQTAAYHALRARESNMSIITGSFFLIAQLRETHAELR